MKQLLALPLLFLFSSLFAQSPPGQPSTGPGGNNYPHASYDSSFYGSTIYDAYWLFEPANPAPTDSAPVVFLWHGTTALNIQTYAELVHMHSGLIRHLARKGNTVVYPLYQFGTQMITGGPNAQRDTCAEIVKKALLELETGVHVRPKRDDQGEIMLGTCGHSRGGNVSVGLSAGWSELGLPKFKAVCANVGFDADAELDSIPSETLWLSVIADNDTNLPNLVTEEVLIEKYCQLNTIPPANKHLLRIHSDSSNTITVIADHHYYEAELGDVTSVNVLDYYGAWKLTTGLFDCAFFGTNCEYALSNPDSITYMGQWSNGVDFAPISILDDTCLTVGITEHADEGMAIAYPNPFREQLTVELNATPAYPAEFVIYDLSGRVVFSTPITQRNTVVSTSGIPAGVYVYQLQLHGRKTLSGRLVRN